MCDLWIYHQNYRCSLENNHSPGMTVMVFRARRTLKVLKTETFPKSTNSVKYLQHKHTASISGSMTYIGLNLEMEKDEA